MATFPVMWRPYTRPDFFIYPGEDQPLPYPVRLHVLVVGLNPESNYEYQGYLADYDGPVSWTPDSATIESFFPGILGTLTVPGEFGLARVVFSGPDSWSMSAQWDKPAIGSTPTQERSKGIGVYDMSVSAGFKALCSSGSRTVTLDWGGGVESETRNVPVPVPVLTYANHYGRPYYDLMPLHAPPNGSNSTITSVVSDVVFVPAVFGTATRRFTLLTAGPDKAAKVHAFDSDGHDATATLPAVPVALFEGVSEDEYKLTRYTPLRDGVPTERLGFLANHDAFAFYDRASNIQQGIEIEDMDVFDASTAFDPDGTITKYRWLRGPTTNPTFGGYDDNRPGAGFWPFDDDAERSSFDSAFSRASTHELVTSTDRQATLPAQSDHDSVRLYVWDDQGLCDVFSALIKPAALDADHAILDAAHVLIRTRKGGAPGTLDVLSHWDADAAGEVRGTLQGKSAVLFRTGGTIAAAVQTSSGWDLRRSHNYGETWESIGMTPFTGRDYLSVAPQASESGAVYYCAALKRAAAGGAPSVEFAASFDGGAHWDEKVVVGLAPNARGVSMLLGEVAGSAELRVVAGSHGWKSADGASWTALPDGVYG